MDNPVQAKRSSG